MQQGGYLVEINNEAEQTEIETRLKALNGKSFTALGTVPDGGNAKYLWIGATDKDTEGFWVWDGDNKGTTIDIGWGTEFNFTTAPGAYINWGGLNRGEPDDYQSNQDAAALAISAPVNGYSWPKGAQYEWNDIAASNSIWFIMEVNN